MESCWREGRGEEGEDSDILYMYDHVLTSKQLITRQYSSMSERSLSISLVYFSGLTAIKFEKEIKY